MAEQLASPGNLLPIFICCETARALFAFAALQHGITLPPAMVTMLGEAVKLSCAIAFHSKWMFSNCSSFKEACASFLPKERNVLSMSQSSLSSSQTSFSSQNEPKAGLTIRLKHIFLPSIPAILYFASGVLYLTGLRFTSPAILSTTMLAKLPMTAALHRIVFNRKRSWIAWIWLTVLCIGLVSLNLPWLDAAQHLIVGDLPGFYRTVTFQDTALPGTTIGACIGFAIAAVSAIASIFTEKLLKQDMQFWAAQFWLYFYGVVFGCLAFLLGVDNMGGAKPSLLVPEQSQFTANMVRAGVILLTGGTGIIVANILRRGDNIVKICGAAAAVASTLICQPFLFPTLWRNTVNPSTLISVGCILQATWAYNYHATKFMRKSPFSPSVAWSPAASGRRKSSVKLEDPLPEYDEEKETAMLLPTLVPSTPHLKPQLDWMAPTLNKFLSISSVFLLAAIGSSFL